MRVENMTNKKTNRAIPNQFIITDNNGSVYFQCYNTIIAMIPCDYKESIPINKRLFI